MSGFTIKRFLISSISGLTTTITLLGTVALLPQILLSQELPDRFLVSQSTYLRAKSAQKETLYLNNDHVYSYRLKTTRNTSINGINVPAGATIVGRYEPAKGGLRYVANAVIFNNRTHKINAISDVLKDVKDPRDTSAAAVAEDAGIGAAGGLVLGEALGKASVGEVLGGAAAGGVVGNVTADRVVVIKPNVPITLYSN